MIPVDHLCMSAEPLLAVIQIVQGALAHNAQSGNVERIGAEGMTTAGAQFGAECRGARGAVEKLGLSPRNLKGARRGLHT
jgi:hypothetical protein